MLGDQQSRANIIGRLYVSMNHNQIILLEIIITQTDNKNEDIETE